MNIEEMVEKALARGKMLGGSFSLVLQTAVKKD